MKIKDCIQNTIAGDWGNEEWSEDAPVKVHCLRSADIVPIYQHNYDDIPYRYVSQNSFDRRELKEGDIVIEKSGGTNNCSTGRPILVSKDLLEKNFPLMSSNFCSAIRLNPEWDPEYVYYYLKLLHKSGVFFNFEGKTSGIHNLDMDAAFSAIEIPDISLKSQKEIVTILSKIEKKIILNTQINAELEAMAKQLYDYWFVQFDFPNEEGKPYKSSGGKMIWNETLKREIPEGWSDAPIKEIAEIFNGATPSTETPENYGGNIIWITPKDLSDQSSKFTYFGQRNITQLGYDSCSTHMLPKQSILLSSRAPIGLVSIADCECCTNQGFKNIVPNNINDSYYMYYYIKNHIKQIEQLGTGTTFKEVSKESLSTFPILIPIDTLKENFIEKISPIFEQQALLFRMTNELQQQRDSLLPLLMNGQVRIKEE